MGAPTSGGAPASSAGLAKEVLTAGETRFALVASRLHYEVKRGGGACLQQRGESAVYGYSPGLTTVF